MAEVSGQVDVAAYMFSLLEVQWLKFFRRGRQGSSEAAPVVWLHLVGAGGYVLDTDASDGLHEAFRAIVHEWDDGVDADEHRYAFSRQVLRSSKAVSRRRRTRFKHLRQFGVVASNSECYGRRHLAQQVFVAHDEV